MLTTTKLPSGTEFLTQSTAPPSVILTESTITEPDIYLGIPEVDALPHPPSGASPATLGTLSPTAPLARPRTSLHCKS